MKILNETYLQQRIEELEQHKIELKERVPENYFNGCINELKLLLANCEEVEVETISEFEDNQIKNKGYLYNTDSLISYLEEQGYKLIKTK